LDFSGKLACRGKFTGKLQKSCKIFADAGNARKISWNIRRIFEEYLRDIRDAIPRQKIGTED